MFEVKFDKELNQFVIGRLGTSNDLEDYLIVSADEFAAKSLCAQISMQMIPAPTESPLKYQSIGLHPNGKTHLYSLKS